MGADSSLAQEQDRIQRLMLAQFINVERLPLEDPANYNRRRMRAISCLTREHGAWGHLHAQRIVDWAAHWERPRNSRSLASLLYAWHGPGWLDARRRDPGIGGADRPGTRASSGPVIARWDDGVLSAKMKLR